MIIIQRPSDGMAINLSASTTMINVDKHLMATIGVGMFIVENFSLEELREETRGVYNSVVVITREWNIQKPLNP